MEMLWFWLVAVTATVYVVMDGFDFGAGALHLFVARADGERRQVLAAIGPLWDGNEVWLLATGTSLFFAFPRLLGAALSGFYLAIFFVVWVLILRGVAIELRSHVEDPMWRSFWDGVLVLASTLAPILFGAALANVVRGVPLEASGYFEMPLFTHLLPSARPGILDAYTVLVGVFALATLAHHGALFLTWKTDGAVQERSRRAAGRLFIAVLVLWALASAATAAVRPDLSRAIPGRPLAWAGALLILAGIVAAFFGRRRGRDLVAFLGSAGFIAGLLAATAAGVYPVMLRSTISPALSLTAQNASVSDSGLRTGLAWWSIGFPLAVAYFVFLFRIHRGKAQVPAAGEGY